MVKLKGLPFKAQPADVLEFFAGFDIKEENIYLKRHPDGRPNGEVGWGLFLCNWLQLRWIAIIKTKAVSNARCAPFATQCCMLASQAFIVFDSASESRRACQKDRETFGDKFGDRYVRVYPTLESDLADMQAAMTQQATQQVS